MKLHVGTSGYSYPAWKGSFYPKDLPSSGMLKYYAGQFQTVEINNSFYRFPKASVLEGWAAEVPPGFMFVLKAPQRITHIGRLKDVGTIVKDFVKVAESLGDHRGPLLFQLPPNMKKDAGRLSDLLKNFSANTRVALEFRHATWFDDEVFGLLRESNAALCIAEAEDGVDAPFVSTADWGYIRLRMSGYTTPELKKRLANVQEQKWSDAFVFFKHEDEAKGPEFAKRFIALAENSLFRGT